MKYFLGKLNARKLGLIAKIAMPIGIALLILAIWGFVKSSHVSMSGKNGASATLIFVHLRWFALVLGVGSLCGGFWLLKKAETSAENDTQTENKEEDDPLDFLK